MSTATSNAVRIERVDPRDLDLDTADALAEVLTASNEAADLAHPPTSAGEVMTYRQLQSDGTPLVGLWLAYDGDRLVGHADLGLPRLENTGTADLRGHVHPDARKRGVGTALLHAALAAVRDAGRTRVYAGAFGSTEGGQVLERWGFTPTPGRYAVRRLDLHASAPAQWDAWHDEAAEHAGDYELVHLTGPTPDDLLPDLALLHEAINDAPANDDDEEPALFDAARVRDYDRAMAGRRQTVYRVLARHRATGEWAGLSILCVNEFSPTLAFQEDTSVVRAHRGHRLGLLMKTDMLRWIAAERPEVAVVDTWNAVGNHHMIAVNERLGATVVSEYVGYRKSL